MTPGGTPAAPCASPATGSTIRDLSPNAMAYRRSISHAVRRVVRQNVRRFLQEEEGSDNNSVGRPSTCGSSSSDDHVAEFSQGAPWPALEMLDEDSGPDEVKLLAQGASPFAEELREEIRRRKSGGRAVTPQRQSSGGTRTCASPGTGSGALASHRLKAWIQSPPWMSTPGLSPGPGQLTPVREAGETPYKNSSSLFDSPPSANCKGGEGRRHGGRGDLDGEGGRRHRG